MKNSGAAGENAAGSRLPRHVGFIPDGNRRWAQGRGLARDRGYAFGIEPGYRLYEECLALGIPEVSIYGFTRDNNKRPSAQKDAFKAACVEFAFEICRRGAALLVVGDDASEQFPVQLREFRVRRGAGIRVNFLVNYGWDWDLEGLKTGRIRMHEIPRLDLVVRWGGGRRLSGFLPVQSMCADFYVIDDYWPDFAPDHFYQALRWFSAQDRTLGG